MPSNEELMREFDVSRIKIRQAVNVLARDGLLEARQGSGILSKLRNPVIAKARQTLTIGTAGLEAARHLGIASNAPVAEVRRVFSAADSTVIYLGEVTYRGDFIHLEMDLKP